MKFEKVIELLDTEKKYAKENYIPIIRDKSAKFLYDFVVNGGYTNILEIGTAIGYSGSIILSAGAKKLTTIDINANYLEIAKETFRKCGYTEKVLIYNDDAKVVLENLCENNEKFDMIFLDGAKGQYINYLPYLSELLDENGVIFADNVLLQGMVESENQIPRKKRSMVNKLRKYIEVVNSDKYETDLIRLEDGIAITRLRGEK